MAASPSAATSSAAAEGLHLDWLDRSVSPAENFYKFANGGWQEEHPIPPAYSRWGIFNILHIRNQKIVREIIEDAAAANAKPGSITQKVGDFYESGMDMEAINEAGVKPLEPVFARIHNISNMKELQRVVAQLQLLGVNAVFHFGSMQDFEDSSRVIGAAFQGGLGLPSRDYYLKTAAACKKAKAANKATSAKAAKAAQATYEACLAHAEKFEETRQAYVAHIAAMFELLGDSQKSAAAEAKTVMAIETAMAEASMPRIKMRNPHAIYNIKTLDELEAITPNFDWQAYFANMGVPNLTSINLATPGFFKALNDQLETVPLSDWKTYLRWQLIDSFAPYLSESFVKENFKMHSALTGAKELLPRWQRVVNAENGALGFAVGKLYVKQEFPPSSKKAVLDILHNIREALKSDLKTLEWMSPKTREAALEKLSLMGERIGYPDKWRSYEKLRITAGPYVENVIAANVFLTKRDLAKIGKPVNKHEWGMTPQTVNAYYSPSRNNINFPAGILQPPFFDPDAPAAVNYGAVGFVMGHEMTHGFDDTGAQFDGHGNLNNWWTPEDLKKFKAATSCISKHFSEYTVNDGLHVKGKLVTGEATADLGGLTLAWRAFKHSDAYEHAKTIHGFTPAQQFFLGAAHVWASNIRPAEARRRVTVDPHPPAMYRVNGTVANMPAFQKAFEIPDDSPMVNEHRCVIW
ncbi:MAG: M13 family metallopeptidase [Gammaproteobacteria bacterium]|nr:M13 family metallopeptidase [Gammaproteobacteria bacterium]